MAHGGATRCQILRLKSSISAGEAYSAPQIAVFKEPTSKEMDEEGRGVKGDGREEKGGWRTIVRTPCRKFLATPLAVAYPGDCNNDPTATTGNSNMAAQTGNTYISIELVC